MTKKALITGATGYLGRRLVHRLALDGWDVYVFVRDGDAARKLLPTGVKIIHGNILDSVSLRHKFPADMDVCFHLAAGTEMPSINDKVQKAINIEGTRAVLETVQDKNCKRLVHLSSAYVYKSDSREINEQGDRNGIESQIAYVQSKCWAERKVREYAERGLDAVILNPGIILGASPSLWLENYLRAIAEDKTVILPSGGVSVVSTSSAIDAIVAAALYGKAGEAYMLGGAYVHYADLLSELALLKGLDPKIRRVTKTGLKLQKWLDASPIKKVFRNSAKHGLANSELMELLSSAMQVDASKAVRELDYREKNWRQILEDDHRGLRFTAPRS